MGIILGYFLVGIMILHLLYPLIRKNHWALKFHKILFYIGVSLIIIHLIYVFKVLDTRNIVINISGFSMLFLLLIAYTFWLITKKKTRKYVHISIAVILVLALGLHMVSYFVDYGSYQTKIQETRLEGIDLTKVSDGIYEGFYDVGYINAKVKVKVVNHEIFEIEIVSHNNERGEKASAIINQIKAMQSTNIDVIAGATNSSLVILKAVEDALK